MKVLKNETGYSLFLTVIIVLLFSILSMTLLSFTISGAKRSEIRENSTQATELADKGLQHIIQQLDNDLLDALGKHGLSKNEFQMRLQQILNTYFCTNESVSPLTPNTETGQYNVCIKHMEPTIDSNGNLNELKQLATVKSIGEVDGITKEIHSKIEVGSGSVPEVLKYAVGSNIRSNNPKNGEGNLLLHGGVDIFGDVRVDGHLVSYEKGTGAYKWIDSIQPRMYEIIPGVQPRIVVGKNMYKLKNNPYNTGNERTHANYLNNDNFNLNRYQLSTNPADLFDPGYVPVAVKREPRKENIEIREHKSNFFYDHNSNVTLVNLSSNRQFNNFTSTSHKLVPFIERCGIFTGCTKKYDEQIVFWNTNTFKSLALGGSGHFRAGTHTFSDGLYVNGRLNIGNLSQTDNENARDNITIDGTMYVDGKLTIQGANLTSNAMIYVDGDVEIRYSSIKGKQLPDGDIGTLIIFATGNIYLANNSVHKDDPTHIRGYFYSEKNIETYGVGSNIHIDGGIAGNRVVLNAIRGKVIPENGRHTRNVSGVGIVETIERQRNAGSRLTIKYDPDLIENFLKLNPPEPVINNIDPIEVIERKIRN